MKQQRFLKGISLALLLLLACTLFASCGGKKVSQEDAELRHKRSEPCTP